MVALYKIHQLLNCKADTYDIDGTSLNLKTRNST